MKDALLPGLPADLIRAAYANAPGNEIDSGKFASPESSAALAANTFGFFLTRPVDLPAFPNGEWGWPARSIALEAIVRFPWAGGRHPCLDVLIETETALIGIESKRYEPFRSEKQSSDWSDAYWRAVWGEEMAGYQKTRDGLRDETMKFRHLDSGQLVKHAFGLRTAIHRGRPTTPKSGILVYLYAEPGSWPDGRSISPAMHETHRTEVMRFSELVEGDEIAFHACSYRELLSYWRATSNTEIQDHAEAVLQLFDV